MTNNVLYVSDGNYGIPAGRMSPLVQGQYGQTVPIEVRDLAGNVVNLTGYTVTGHKSKRGNVTAIVGGFTLSATPAVAPQISGWLVDEADTGEGGAFSFLLEMTNGTQVLKTHPVSLTITPDPAVNATPAAGLVGVLTSWRTILGALYNAAQAATVGQVFIFDGDGSGAEGDAAGGGVSDHGGLTGLGDDDHSQYHNDTRGDTRYTQRANNLSDVADAPTARTNLGAQAFSALLTAIAALTGVANGIVRFTAAAAVEVVALASHIWTFLESADAAAARTAIGAGTGNGDVVGPASSTDHAIARYDLTTGKLLQGSAVTIDDVGNLNIPGANTVASYSVKLNTTTLHQGSIDLSSSILRIIGMSGTSLAFYADSAERVRVTNTGIGIGVTANRGRIHSYDTGGGFLHVYKSGVVGSAVAVIPNGTGDVTLVLSGTFTVSDGAGNVAGGVITATAPSGTFNLYDDGGTNTLQLQVAADGSVTVIRTAGSRTYAVNLTLNWM